jgi:hypothetical protein
MEVVVRVRIACITRGFVIRVCQSSRNHRTEQSPVFFGPAPGRPPTLSIRCTWWRVPHPVSRAITQCRFVETLLRNPRIPFIEQTELEERAVAVLTNRDPLKLVDLRGDFLSRSL